jgi:hypothetical protein
VTVHDSRIPKTRGPRFRRAPPGTREHVADQERIGCANQRFIRLGGRTATKIQSRNRGDSLLCPTDLDPASFKWPVSGCTVYVLNTKPTCEELAKRLCRELLAQGADYVYWHYDGETRELIGHAIAAARMFDEVPVANPVREVSI